MDGLKKSAIIISELVYSSVVFAFFYFLYPYHITFQEQFQLFEFSLPYFLEVVSVPGGLADYISGFLSQFFILPWLGAMISAFVLSALHWICFLCISGRNNIAYILSFIPSILLFAFHLDENALLSADIAILFPMLIFHLFKKNVNEGKCSDIIAVVLVPVLYFLIGPLSIVFAFLFFLSEDKSLSLILITESVLLPLIFGCFINVKSLSLFFGLHYYRLPGVFPILPWMSALSVIIICTCSRFLRGLDGNVLYPVLSLPLLSIILIAFLGGDSLKEEAMKYDYLARFEKWDLIIQTAEKKDPNAPLQTSCVNLALAMKWQMHDRLFNFRQNGREGLFPKFTRDFMSPLSLAEIYYHLGMTNTAQRLTFEAQEAIPDFQKSARCFKRLAETNIINGDYPVARKYIRTLERTIFYRRWAKTMEDYLDKGVIFERIPELSTLRSNRLKNHDFFFSEEDIDQMLRIHLIETPNNVIASQYLESLNRLERVELK